MRAIRFNSRPTAASRRHHIDEADVRVVLSRLWSERIEHAGPVHNRLTQRERAQLDVLAMWP